jgi:large subunit ribosomal protein L4
MSVVLPVFSDSGVQSGNLELTEDVFGRPFNEPLIHQVVVSQLAGRRAGTHAQKNRASVRGGGAKPWRQKGSGRARAGTIRSPLWRGGGVTFAATPQDYSLKVNKKMYRGAMRSIFSELIRQDRLVVVDAFDIENIKTKSFLSKIKSLNLESALVVTYSMSEELYLSSRNLFRFLVADVEELDPPLLLKFPKVLITQEALKQIESTLQ